MTLLRRVLGETLRGQRLRQRRTLREVSGAARVSLGYLSEVERGQKEASSELLASICEALDVRLSEILRQVSDNLRRTELVPDVARGPARQLVPAAAAPAGSPAPKAQPIGGDGAGFGVGLELPVDFGADRDRAGTESVDASRFDGDQLDASQFDSDQFDTDQFDTDQFDTDQFDTGRFDTDRSDTDRFDGDRFDGDLFDAERFDPSRLGPDRLDAERPDPDGPEPDRTGLDGVDLAELETGDGLADLDALLSLTDLSCCLAESHDSPRCLAGAVAAA
jgi:XRE family transcriptional regulator, stress-response regulator